MNTPWTFDRFAEDAVIGECTLATDAAQLASWHAVGGRTAGTDTHLPAGLLVALSMRGYMTVVTPRPPGNVHGSSILRWGDASAPVGQPLTARVRCLGRQLARERRWVRLGVELARADGALVLAHEIKMLWAA